MPCVLCGLEAMMPPAPQTRSLTIKQGTPEWAFIAACRALQAIKAGGAGTASVRLFADGSGELRIPRQELKRLANRMKPETLFDLVGSERIDSSDVEEQDFVVRQCGGFAWSDL